MPLTVRNHLNFEWNFSDFSHLIAFRVTSIKSPELVVRCFDLTYWTLFLDLSYLDTGFILAARLHREQEKDELDDVNVQLTVKVTLQFKQAQHSLREASPWFCMRRKAEDTMMVFSQDTSKMLQCINQVKFEFVIDIKVDSTNATTWNNNEGLCKLRMDIAKLCFNENLGERYFLTIPSDDREYTKTVHCAILHARWPQIVYCICELRYLEEQATIEEWDSKRLMHGRLLKVLDIISTKWTALEEDLQYGSPAFEAFKSFQAEDARNNLTETVCDKLLDFLYSGNPIVHDKEVLRKLIGVSRFFDLQHLVYKFTDFPTSCIANTVVCEEIVEIEWLKSDSDRWKDSRFKPFSQILTLPTTAHLMVHVTFLMNRDEKFHQEQSMRVQVLLTGKLGLFPCRYSFVAEDATTGEVRQEESAILCLRDSQIATFPFRVLKGDLLAQMFKLKLIFFSEPHTVLHESSTEISSTETVRPKSLHLLSKDLRRLYEDQIHTDIAILCPDGRLMAHRYILAARSPWFYERLGENLKSQRCIETSVSDKVLVMDKVLIYVYSGRLEFNGTEDLNLLRHAAFKFGLNHFKEECESLLTKNLGKYFNTAF